MSQIARVDFRPPSRHILATFSPSDFLDSAQALPNRFSNASSMQLPSHQTAESALTLNTPRRRRLTVRACVALALLTLFVLGGVGTAAAIVMLQHSEGSLEGY